jgi:hypothetical protein
MDELVTRLRRDAELEEAEAADSNASGDAFDDALLTTYFATHLPTWSDAALEWLSQQGERDAQPSDSGDASPALPQPRARTVQEALAPEANLARSALSSGLGISIDAAELLLERPASALMSYPARKVAFSAAACGRTRGQVFAVIAESLRAGAPYVFAYRRGAKPSVPAKRVADPVSEEEQLLAWGRELFADPSVGHQTSR